MDGSTSQVAGVTRLVSQYTRAPIGLGVHLDQLLCNFWSDPVLEIKHRSEDKRDTAQFTVAAGAEAEAEPIEIHKPDAHALVFFAECNSKFPFVGYRLCVGAGR
jgi:hypothetical protein